MDDNPNGWLCVADPDWLDYLAKQSDLRSIVYYKGPYRPLTKLPLDAPFVCCRRGETPRRIHVIGMFNGCQVLTKQNAWKCYHRRLGVPSAEQWLNMDVGTDDKISCHELINFRFFDNPPLLNETSVTLSDPASSMGRYLSQKEADEILTTVGELTPNSPSLPEEVPNPFKLFEGAFTQILVNSYERNRNARNKCIDHYGAVCQVCGIRFTDVYGDIGEGFIHVHHLVPLSSISESYQVNPIEDLRPVCPNCHAIIHKKVPPYTCEELKAFLSHNSKLGI